MIHRATANEIGSGEKREPLFQPLFFVEEMAMNKMILYFILLYSKLSDGYETKNLTNPTVSGKELRVSIGEVLAFLNILFKKR